MRNATRTAATIIAGQRLRLSDDRVAPMKRVGHAPCGSDEQARRVAAREAVELEPAVPGVSSRGERHQQPLARGDVPRSSNLEAGLLAQLLERPLSEVVEMERNVPVHPMPAEKAAPEAVHVRHDDVDRAARP